MGLNDFTPSQTLEPEAMNAFRKSLDKLPRERLLREIDLRLHEITGEFVVEPEENPVVKHWEKSGRSEIYKIIDKAIEQKPIGLDEAAKVIPEFDPLGEALSDIQRLEKQGASAPAWARAASWVIERIPGAGTGLRTHRLFDEWTAARQIAAGKGSDEDYRVLAWYINEHGKEAREGLGDKIVDTVTRWPAFAFEFAATGGVYSGVKGGVERALLSRAGKYVTGLTARAAGVTAQAAVLPQMIAEGAARQLAKDYDLNVDDAGRLAVALRGDVSGPGAAFDGAIDTVIELGSERSGKLLDMAGPAAAKLAGKWFPRMTKSAQRVAARAGAVERWLKLKGGRGAEELTRALRSETGLNSVLGEVFEERVGEAARAATGIEPLPYETIQQAGIQLVAETAAFGIISGVTHAAGRIADAKRRKRMAAQVDEWAEKVRNERERYTQEQAAAGPAAAGPAAAPTAGPAAEPTAGPGTLLGGPTGGQVTGVPGGQAGPSGGTSEQGATAEQSGPSAAAGAGAPSPSSFTTAVAPSGGPATRMYTLRDLMSERSVAEWAAANRANAERIVRAFSAMPGKHPGRRALQALGVAIPRQRDRQQFVQRILKLHAGDKTAVSHAEKLGKRANAAKGPTTPAALGAALAMPGYKLAVLKSGRVVTIPPPARGQVGRSVPAALSTEVPLESLWRPKVPAEYVARITSRSGKVLWANPDPWTAATPWTRSPTDDVSIEGQGQGQRQAQGRLLAPPPATSVPPGPAPAAQPGAGPGPVAVPTPGVPPAGARTSRGKNVTGVGNRLGQGTRSKASAGIVENVEAAAPISEAQAAVVARLPIGRKGVAGKGATGGAAEQRGGDDPGGVRRGHGGRPDPAASTQKVRGGNAEKGKRKPRRASRRGIVQAETRVRAIFAKYKELIVGEDPDFESESFHRWGYTFPNSPEGRSHARELRERLPKHLHVRVGVAKTPEESGSADGSDVVAEIGIDEMANAMIRHAEGGTTTQLETTMAWMRDNPGVASPIEVRRVLEWYAISGAPESAEAVANTRITGIKVDSLGVGDSVEIATFPYTVENVDSETGAVALDGEIPFWIFSGSLLGIDQGTYRKKERDGSFPPAFETAKATETASESPAPAGEAGAPAEGWIEGSVDTNLFGRKMPTQQPLTGKQKNILFEGEDVTVKGTVSKLERPAGYSDPTEEKIRRRYDPSATGEMFEEGEEEEKESASEEEGPIPFDSAGPSTAEDRASRRRRRARRAAKRQSVENLAGPPSVGEPADVDQLLGLPEELATLQGIGLPELYELASIISQDRVALSDLVGGILGQFVVGSQRIAVERALAVDTDKLARTLAHELGHLIDYLGKNSDANTMGRGNLLGRIRGLSEYLAEYLGENPQGAPPLTDEEKKALWEAAAQVTRTEKEIDEEIEQVLGLSPKDILAIWNNVNQEQLDPELVKYVARMDSKDKKLVILAAMKGIIHPLMSKFGGVKKVKIKTGKRIKVIVETYGSRADRTTRFKEAVAEEIKKRRLLHENTIRLEAIKLSQAWRPHAWDRPKYASMSTELYADFLSALLVSPGFAKRHAPEFFRGFLGWLENKPSFRKEWTTIQYILGGDSEELAKHRADRLEEMWDTADEHLFALVQLRKEHSTQTWLSALSTLKQFAVHSGAPVFARQNKLKKKGIHVPEGEDARMILKDWGLRENDEFSFLLQSQRVINPLLEEGITINDINSYMFLRRIVEGDRHDLGNPLAYEPKSAAEQLAALKQKLGDKRFNRLDTAMLQWHREILWPWTEKAVKSGIYSRKMREEILEPNKDNYAAFAITKYLQGDFVGSQLMEQVGTWEGALGPFHGTVLKFMATIRAINANNAKRGIMAPMAAYFPQDVYRVTIPFEGVKDLPRAPEGFEYVYTLQDGAPVVFAARHEIARVLKNHDVGGLIFLRRLIGTPMYQVFHKLYVTFSDKFQALNLPRDFFRSWRNITSLNSKIRKAIIAEGLRAGMKPDQAIQAAKKSKITFGRLLAAYWRTKGTAWRRARGITDDTILEMYNDKALAIPFVNIGDSLDEATAYQRSIRRYLGGPSRTEKARTKLGKATGKILDIVEAGTAFTETWTKAAAYDALKRAGGLTSQERSYAVHNYAGTPNWKEGGSAALINNSIFLYERVRVNAIMSDFALATDPETRAGWWLRTGLVWGVSLATRLARYGLMGKLLKELYDTIAAQYGEYFFDSYMPLPFLRTDGSVSFVAIPLDYTQRTINAVLNRLLDAMGVLPPDAAQLKTTEHLLNEAAQAVLDQALPTWNPFAAIGWNWAQYAQDRNPYDGFRRRNVVPERMWDAGGLNRVMPMIGWTIDQLGVLGGFAWPIRETLEQRQAPQESTWEWTVKSLPFVRALIRTARPKVDLSASDRAALALAEHEQAVAYMKLPGTVRTANRNLYMLNALPDSRLNLEREAHRWKLSQWQQNQYQKRTAEIWEAMELGDTDRATEIRKELGVSAAAAMEAGPDDVPRYIAFVRTELRRILLSKIAPKTALGRSRRKERIAFLRRMLTEYNMENQGD